VSGSEANTYDVEEEIVATFYSPYPAKLAAQALGPSRGSLLAHTEPNKARRPQRLSKPMDSVWTEGRHDIHARCDHCRSTDLMACAVDLV